MVVLTVIPALRKLRQEDPELGEGGEMTQTLYVYMNKKKN
jgi:hypothetical protein